MVTKIIRGFVYCSAYLSLYLFENKDLTTDTKNIVLLAVLITNLKYHTDKIENDNFRLSSSYDFTRKLTKKLSLEK